MGQGKCVVGQGKGKGRKTKLSCLPHNLGIVPVRLGKFALTVTQTHASVVICSDEKERQSTTETDRDKTTRLFSPLLVSKARKTGIS
jgi:hypothetical protein